MAKLLRERKAWAKIEILKAIERLAIGVSSVEDCEAIEHLSQAYCNLSGLHFLRGPKGEVGPRREPGPAGPIGPMGPRGDDVF